MTKSSFVSLPLEFNLTRLFSFLNASRVPSTKVQKAIGIYEFRNENNQASNLNILGVNLNPAGTPTKVTSIAFARVNVVAKAGEVTVLILVTVFCKSSKFCTPKNIELNDVVIGNAIF